MMIETKIESIRVSLVTQQRVVILKELNAERYLPIWIGPFEADAIALELQEMPVTRPLTHDLLKSVITELGGQVTSVLINDMREDVFYARIIMDVSGRHAEVDSRPSDAIALALRVKAPIFVDESVMEKTGVVLDNEGAQPANATTTVLDDEKLSVFRDFINSLDIDDLGNKKQEEQ